MREEHVDHELAERQKLQKRPSRARYDVVHHSLERKWRRRELKAERMMREIVDVLWDNFAGAPYSWCGFYVLKAGGQELVLGPHREKPACSPLAMHGVCGKVAKTGQAMIVPDVKTLGDEHIACDPRTVSEICVPVYDKDGKVWGVFDVDSEQPAAFDEMDARWLQTLLSKFQSAPRPEA